MLAYTIFVKLQSLVVISTHADRQSVDMSITVCLFVNLSLCTVTDFSAWCKASGVKFFTMVHGHPGNGISHFKNVLSKKGHRIKGAGVRTPWTPRLDPPLFMSSLYRSKLC